MLTGRMWSGFSSEIETGWKGTVTSESTRRRMWSGFSSEIETIDMLST